MRKRKDQVRATRQSRPGVAAVELALMLPLLALLFVVTVDFARVFYFSVTLQNSARAGAVFASDPHVAGESPFASVQEAALADAQNLSPRPTIAQSYGTDSAGRTYVEVKATYTFTTITKLLGIHKEMKLSRAVRMYPSAITPDA